MTKMSPAQRGLWAGHLMAIDKTLYNTAECIVFAGKVDEARLHKALVKTVLEADCLNSFYTGEELHSVPDDLPLAFEKKSWNSDLTLLTDLREWAWQEELKQSFDLQKERPCRFVLWQGSKVDILYMSAHHIALDGFGYSLFWKRLAALYSEREDFAFAPFAPALVSEQDERASRDFWLGRFSNHDVIPPFGENEAELGFGYEEADWILPPVLWEKLTTTAQEIKSNWADMFTLFLAVEAYLRTGKGAQSIGLPIMNRSGAQTKTPSLQMNIQPLLLKIEDHLSLRDLTAQMAVTKRALRAHQSYRHEAIMRDLRGKGIAQERLFAAVINILPFSEHLDFAGVGARKEIICSGPVADFSLTVHYLSRHSPPRLQFLGQKGVWTKEKLISLQEDFCDLLTRALQNPQKTVKDLKNEVLQYANAKHALFTPTPHVTEGVLEKFVKWATKDPERIALEDGERKWSYGELLTQAEIWQASLQARGLQPGDAVGVALERSGEAILAILAIMGIGACYVPLDTKQPEERQKEILAQAQVKMILTHKDYPWLNSSEPKAFCHTHTSLAYTLFTSGSSGKPKGVVISSDALNHFVHAAQKVYRVESDDRVLQFAPFHFDTSLEEVFLTLAHGATLVLRTDSMLESFNAFTAELTAMRISFLDLPTAYWASWVEAIHYGFSHVPSSLKTVVLGGEAVYAATLKKWFVHVSGVRLINSYGPTETTIIATALELKVEHASWSALPIGQPLSGVGALIVGPGGRPSVEGELMIFGPTVGSHYLGTQERLRQVLNVGDESFPAYGTGDRVRRSPEGLVFLGRRDDEFKISGHRVHPREVETNLLRIPGVTEALVQGVMDQKGRRRLVAFVGGERKPQELRLALQNFLPPALVPSVIQVFPSLPKTSSHKIDRRGLLEKWQKEHDTHEDSRITHSLIEQVKTIWREELGHDDLDEESHFFHVGGESLQAIQLAVRLSQVFALHVSVADIFAYPRLRDLCTRLQEKQEDEIYAAPLRMIQYGDVVSERVSYIFPGVGGSSDQFMDLVNHLGQNMRVHIAEIRLAAFATMNSLAKACAEQITESKITLIGHSFGGCIAYETAHLLRDRGQDVRLIMLDTYLHLDRGDFLVHYHPSKAYSGPIRMIYAKKAKHYLPTVLEKAKLDDAKLFTGPLEVELAAGDHFSMLGGEHAPTLAKRLQWM